MQKRYQVFVSSTFKDLEEERKEVMQALLELWCFPAGMELFPATNESQWLLIQRVIDDSDFYVVIVGGRYGSTDANGRSYTENEYRYAVEKGIPVFGFVHGEPGKIIADKVESDPIAKARLEEFRKLVETRHVKYWKTAGDLGGVVSRAIANAKEDALRPGWVRGDQGLSESHLKQLLDQQRELEDLRKQISQLGGQKESKFEELPPTAQKLLRMAMSEGVLDILTDTSCSRLRFRIQGTRYRYAPDTLKEAKTRSLVREGLRALIDAGFMERHELPSIPLYTPYRKTNHEAPQELLGYIGYSLTSRSSEVSDEPLPPAIDELP